MVSTRLELIKVYFSLKGITEKVFLSERDYRKWGVKKGGGADVGLKGAGVPRSLGLELQDLPPIYMYRQIYRSIDKWINRQIDRHRFRKINI